VCAANAPVQPASEERVWASCGCSEKHVDGCHAAGLDLRMSDLARFQKPASASVAAADADDHVWSSINLLAGQALATWGRDVRIAKLFEEMGELQSELAKVLIGHKRADESRVVAEIADVFITLESVAIAFGFERVEAAIPGKLDRLARAIAEAAAKGVAC
jgi:NTP pyrophosphatase (non-canonical NTP hydrolase)